MRRLGAVHDQWCVSRFRWITSSGCPLEDSIFCLQWKLDGCEESGRIEIIIPGLVNDSDLVVALSLFIGYALVPCVRTSRPICRPRRPRCVPAWSSRSPKRTRRSRSKYSGWGGHQPGRAEDGFAQSGHCGQGRAGLLRILAAQQRRAAAAGRRHRLPALALGHPCGHRPQA